MKPVPYKLPPLEDESPTSWLLRLARKYHCDVVTFLDFYECANLVKVSIDIDSDLSMLKKFIPTDSHLPLTISDKIIDFQWVHGRSEWLFGNNRKGSSALNSFTQICPICTKEKGYYKLKWKLRIFTYCLECQQPLIKCCFKCGGEVSLHKYFRFRGFQPNSIDYLNCSYCESSLSKKEKFINSITFEMQLLKSYSEEPPNLPFLKETLKQKQCSMKSLA